MWQGGFALNIGICSAALAELWGEYYELFIAWDRGIRRVEVEVDSESVVGFLKTWIQDSNPLSFLVRLCYGFISRDWTVKISHIYREANHLADGLANFFFTFLVFIYLRLFERVLFLFRWRIVMRCLDLGEFACNLFSVFE